MISAEKIVEYVEKSIAEWHADEGLELDERIAPFEQLKKRKRLDEHRDNIYEAVAELTKTNSEIWHEEDRVRKGVDEVIVRSVRKMNVYNVHRNDLVEEIDEIVIETSEERLGK